MRWFRRSAGEPVTAREGAAELITPNRKRFATRVEVETADLSDAETVRRWIRALVPGQQVSVARPWGTVVAMGDGKDPVGILLADGDKCYVAEPPGATTIGRGGFADLTLDQVEHVMVEAMTSPERPQWPKWSVLV